MPLRLKHLEIQGYKSFAGKTEFVFGPGVSAIVGPNGSGKSNIVDGIRWVLGEQSYSLLRGKKTEDMIFAGSDLRPRAGLAQVTLTFDNSDGWLPIDFTEVAIGRRAYRDGENEYLLNGQRVRLRDIQELLAKCGLAERTYTIIGQGLIDTALSLKAEERRALFEEAAGIGLYRHKREDALKKLDATQRNLDRVLDILAEIKPRLRSLERQAARARDYNFIKEDLKAVLKQWYGYHWHRVSRELEEARRQAENAAIELFGLQSHQEKYDREMTELRARMATLRARANELRVQTEARRDAAETLTRAVAVAEERLRSLAEQRQGLLAEMPALEAQLAERAARAAAALAEVARLAAEADEARAQATAAKAALTGREAERDALRRRESEARDTLARLDAEIITLNARRSELLERRRHLHAQIESLNAILVERERVEQSARSKLAEADAQLSEQQRNRAEAERRLAEQNDRVRHSEAAHAEAIERTAAARAEAEGLRARREVLEQARAELAGMRSGARALLARHFPARGVLAEMLNVPAYLEKAISAALGLHLEGVVLGSLEEVEAALDVLGESSGRAALLPLDLIAATQPNRPSLTLPEHAPADPDCLGVAAHLLEVDAALRPPVDLLLGNVLVVTNRAAARRWQPLLPPGGAVVTLNGEVFTAAGPVYGGGEASPDLLQQARERRDLSAEIAVAAERITELEQAQAEAAQAVDVALETLVRYQAALRDAQDAERRATIARDSVALEAERAAHELQFRREQLHALEKEAEQLSVEADATQRRLAELAEAKAAAEAEAQSAAQALSTFTVEELAARLARWQTMMDMAARAVQEAQTRADEAARAQAAAKARLEEARNKAAQLEAEMQQLSASLDETRARSAALQTELQDIQAALQPTLAQLAELEAEQARIEAGDAEARAILHAAERRHAQIQLEATRKREELEGLRRRIEEDFGLVEFEYTESVTGPQPLPFQEIVEKLERVDVLPEGLEEQLNRKRGQLRRMGAINPEAEREYNEVRERHDFLMQQMADLEAARAQLREVIAEMDVLMEREFRKTFDAVNAEFREMFTRLFGGGSARLVLTDPEQVATSGVDIQCKLPGKKAQGLSVLSGGERSLTACALIFALLKVNPTPFVVLDEVDAMLDEANIGRYREMLSELSQQTQFIIVTHNRNTVQVAETVYGITMGADSASQVISLKLDGQPLKR
ncbi:MAG: chromosome segregation protein SMC [Anaerolineales bacterium]|nr:chromosome segregation protein SMC [Anaerolineales bacterium]